MSNRFFRAAYTPLLCFKFILNVHLVCAMLCLVSCNSLPAWIHQLPAQQTIVPIVSLKGVWERKIDSRYSVADMDAYSTGYELLDFKPESRYLKVHSYIEVKEKMINGWFFREEGTYQINGRWILLTPKISKHYQVPALKVSGKADVKNFILKNEPKDADYKDYPAAKPLLYYYSLDDSYGNRETLTPLAYEREGKIFPFGFYTGFSEPYNDQGEGTIETLKVFRDKQFPPHSYFYPPPIEQKSELYLRK